MFFEFVEELKNLRLKFRGSANQRVIDVQKSLKANEIITIEQLMDMLNIGKNTAYKLLDSKAIKAFRIGNKWKIPLSSVYSYINEKTECAE